MVQLEQMHTEFHSTIGRVIDAKNIDDMELAKQEKDKVYALSQRILTQIDDIDEELYAATHTKTSVSKPATKAKSPVKALAPVQKTKAPQSAAPVAPKPNNDEWTDF